MRKITFYYEENVANKKLANVAKELETNTKKQQQ